MIRWRPYQLDPDLPEEGVDRKALMESKFGADPERFKAVHAALMDRATTRACVVRFVNNKKLFPNGASVQQLT